MSDVFSKAKRSDVMSRIRSRGNKATELAFMKLLRDHHISGWRRHLPVRLEHEPGAHNAGKQRPRVRPDFVFRASRVAVFIDGCFWHGCPKHGAKPKDNAEFWLAKLTENKKRDRYVNKTLRREKWTVLRIWEHQLFRSDLQLTELNRKLEQIVRKQC